MSPRPTDSLDPLKPLKWYKKLATKKGRLEAGAFCVEGTKAIAHLMQRHPQAILEILTVEEPRVQMRSYPVRRVTESQLRAICTTKAPQGTAAVVRLPLAAYADDLPHDTGTHIVLLEDIQDPGNVGTLIRTAVAFGFHGVILSEKCADAFAPKCVQATAGTVLDLWLRRTPRYLALMQRLREKGYTCVATDLSGSAEPPLLCTQHQLLLALGNEASGLSQSLVQMADYRLKIPLNPRAESLNVAVCGAICMYMSAQGTGRES